MKNSAIVVCFAFILGIFSLPISADLVEFSVGTSGQVPMTTDRWFKIDPGGSFETFSITVPHMWTSTNPTPGQAPYTLMHSDVVGGEWYRYNTTAPRSLTMEFFSDAAMTTSATVPADWLAFLYFDVFKIPAAGGTVFVNGGAPNGAFKLDEGFSTVRGNEEMSYNATTGAVTQPPAANGDSVFFGQTGFMVSELELTADFSGDVLWLGIGFNKTAIMVPEPSPVALLGLVSCGVGVVMLVKKRRKKIITSEEEASV